VEGYSNFLHVLVLTVFLRAVELAGAAKLAAVGVAKVYSLLCGAALVGVTAHTLRRILSDAPWHAAAASTFIVLAGPLGVWSASSLETAPFALAVGLVVIGLTPEVRWPWWTVAVSGIAVLHTRRSCPKRSRFDTSSCG
jgi:hypothetical protein